jgi:hypothetical protein
VTWAPADVAAREREGRETPKREGVLAEDAGREKWDEPMGGEGKNCFGKRREGGRDLAGGIARGESELVERVVWGRPMRVGEREGLRSAAEKG